MMPIEQPADHSGIVVLGGGLAGLAASLDTGAPVYEAAEDWGGASASDRCDGFTFDRGIHLLQTTNMKVVRMLEDLGVDFEIIERSAHIYAFGKYTAYPFQINSTNLPLDRRLRCVWTFMRRAKNPQPTNYAEWIYRTIGRGFGDTFLIPYSEKFWGVHPREMSFEWTGNRVPKSNSDKCCAGPLSAATRGSAPMPHSATRRVTKVMAPSQTRCGGPLATGCILGIARPGSIRGADRWSLTSGSLAIIAC